MKFFSDPVLESMATRRSISKVGPETPTDAELAELLIAIVASPTEHPKVPRWEQLAVAAGAGHLLELALWQAGWGVMWRTGVLANSDEVRDAHGLAESEHLMGWLYVGSIEEPFRRRLQTSSRPALDPHQFLGRMPS